MTEGLDALANMEYPGRFIILGRDESGTSDVVVYGVTGRSPSSQARKFSDLQKGVISTQVTDEEQLKNGSPSLLIYPALAVDGRSIVVSNGAQTELLQKSLARAKRAKNGASALTILEKALSEPHVVEDPKFGEIDLAAYEPDKPNYTPRISGCIHKGTAALSILTHGEGGEVNRVFHEVPLEQGKGSLISTYTGVNQNPLPSFQGEPLEVGINESSARLVAQAAYDALYPQDPEKDFRVCVLAFHSDFETGEKFADIVNRHDMKGD